MRYLLFIFCFLSFCTLAWAQQFSNLNFLQKCDTSKTGYCYWDLSWGKKESVRPIMIDGRNCLLIQGNSENAVSFTEQSVAVNGFKTISILTISATIKSDIVIGKGAGLNIGLYDKDGLLIANKDMGGFYSIAWIKGVNDWKKYSISLVCPLETKRIKIGAIFFGKGSVWFRDYQAEISSTEDRKPSKLALEYIGAACDSIKSNSLVRDSINIQLLKETALKIAGPAKKYEDCYLAINYLLESLRSFGDEHSFLMTVAEVKNWKNEGSQVSKIQYLSYKIIDSCGYILVPPFHGGNQKLMLDFADSMQTAIQKLYDAGVKGWLIDLRQNTGGNMAPMIAGLGPLFISEKLGSLIDVNGKPNAWYYKNGRYFWDDDAGWKVSNPVVLSAKLPIAVLTGNQTGSSGEAVAVSFIGNPETKSFGQPTWGLTTGNGSFELKDGSQIFIASTIMSDRNGNKYGDSIKPDFFVGNPVKTEIDTCISTAIKWIKAR